MGEAKRRSSEISQIKEEKINWKKSLTSEETEILFLAEKLDKYLVRGRQFSGGCYHLAFFITHYLNKKNIIVKPIIGWVNDGSWDGVSSYAWVEFIGKKTDASLTYTSNKVEQPTGNLIVQDYVLHKGSTSYTYYQNDDPAALEKIDRLKGNADISEILKHKLSEHDRMSTIASENRIDDYLSKAPRGYRYNDLIEMIGDKRV